jgi:Domain of unknown function (DUF1987).
MLDLFIDKTSSTPNISFNANSGVLKIEGRSIMEDAATFYAPILTWLSLYVKEPQELTVFDIKLEYINSGSSKAILTLLKTIKRVQSLDNAYKINWYYEEDDEAIRDLGWYLGSMLNAPFELIEIV